MFNFFNDIQCEHLVEALNVNNEETESDFFPQDKKKSQQVCLGNEIVMPDLTSILQLRLTNNGYFDKENGSDDDGEKNQIPEDKEDNENDDDMSNAEGGMSQPKPEEEEDKRAVTNNRNEDNNENEESQWQRQQNSIKDN